MKGCFVAVVFVLIWALVLLSPFFLYKAAVHATDQQWDGFLFLLSLICLGKVIHRLNGWCFDKFHENK